MTCFNHNHSSFAEKIYLNTGMGRNRLLLFEPPLNPLLEKGGEICFSLESKNYEASRLVNDLKTACNFCCLLQGFGNGAVFAERKVHCFFNLFWIQVAFKNVVQVNF